MYNVMPHKEPIMTVRDVYGDTYRVSRTDYEGTRTQLRLYTASGIRLSEYHSAMGWSGKVTTLHRGNIAEVIHDTAPLKETPGVLRETPWFFCTQAKRGVRITSKFKNDDPHSHVVSQKLWDQLKRLNDKEFDATVVVEVGIGVFDKN